MRGRAWMIAPFIINDWPIWALIGRSRFSSVCCRWEITSCDQVCYKIANFISEAIHCAVDFIVQNIFTGCAIASSSEILDALVWIGSHIKNLDFNVSAGASCSVICTADAWWMTVTVERPVIATEWTRRVIQATVFAWGTILAARGTGRAVFTAWRTWRIVGTAVWTAWSVFTAMWAARSVFTAARWNFPIRTCRCRIKRCDACKNKHKSCEFHLSVSVGLICSSCWLNANKTAQAILYKTVDFVFTSRDLSHPHLKLSFDAHSELPVHINIYANC